MEDWSETKRDCYYDFIEQMLKDGYIRKPRKNLPKKQDFSQEEEEMFEEFWFAGMTKIGDKQKTKAKYIDILRKIITSRTVFHSQIIEDIETRIKNKQYGFNKMHPLTYLNQSRWNDEIVEPEQKLLKVPADDNELERFAKKHGLSKPTPTEKYFEYRTRLSQEIKDNKIFEQT